MRTVAVSNGPIAFFTDAGQQLSIPVSELAFEDGQLQVPEQYSAATDWLKYLVKTGAVWSGEASAPKPALVIRAIERGSSGNNISVEFSYAEDKTLDIAVTRRDEYQLDLDTLLEVLGTDEKPGLRPGLVQVLDNDKPPLLPAETAETALALDKGVPSLGIAPYAPPNGQADGQAFVLTAKPGTDAALIKVAISDVDPVRKSFKLVAHWTKKTTGTSPASGVQALNDQFSYLLHASAPPEGAQPPQAGKLLLRGGADAVTASVATLSKS